MGQRMKFTDGGVEPSDIEILPHRVDIDGREAGQTEEADRAGTKAQDEKSRCCCPKGHLGVDTQSVRSKCQNNRVGQKQLVCPTGVAYLFVGSPKVRISCWVGNLTRSNQQYRQNQCSPPSTKMYGCHNKIPRACARVKLAQLGFRQTEKNCRHANPRMTTCARVARRQCWRQARSVVHLAMNAANTQAYKP